MNREQEIIELINKYMPRSRDQLNRPFEADSEIIACSEGHLLYNIDDFSEEDLLIEDNPYALGWNMAAGTISDILASGGKPLYYAHSMVVRNTWNGEFVEKMAQGIAGVLRETGTAFIGGDMGISEKWRYTGSVIGHLKGSPLMRSGAKAGDSFYLTGLVGSGNFQAALNLYTNNHVPNKLKGVWKNFFRLRHREAELIRKYSSCCIDTSDGVFNALNEVSKQSQTGFEIDNLPYVKMGAALAKVLGLPKELLFLGECGEYELLFTLKRESENDFLKEALEKKLIFYKIGRVTKDTKLLRKGERDLDLTGYNLRARDYPKTEEYLRDVLGSLKRRSQ